MSKYPTMDQYNDAVQHPMTAFSDADLKASKIKTNAMGLPFALGGGFALTYTATSGRQKFAVRCFHKEAHELDVRYAKISQALSVIKSSYFVGFKYQKAGVLVNGSQYPLVKMDWVEGDTLGVFIEDNYKDAARVTDLVARFASLEASLQANRISHGDLQNGNVIVKNDIKLIDYDGMYVPGMVKGRGAELGHKHFQHPDRSASDFGPEMDRFSFISINLGLRAISLKPELFERYSSGENILLTASDYANPAASPLFSEMKSLPSLSRDVENFANICAASVTATPTLSDFLAGKNIPSSVIVIQTKTQMTANPRAKAAYVPAFSVVAGANYGDVTKQIGNVIELIGEVKKVYAGKTKYGRPYWFVFFSQGVNVVKLNIWSNADLQGLGAPGESWVGSWLSVTGLIDPIYSSKKFGDSVSITPSSKMSVRMISSSEAKIRLASGENSRPSRIRSGGSSTGASNAELLNGFLHSSPKAHPGKSAKSPSRVAVVTSNVAKQVAGQSKNQQLLSAIKAKPLSSPPQRVSLAPTPKSSNVGIRPSVTQPGLNTQQPNPKNKVRSFSGIIFWLVVLAVIIVALSS